MSPFKALYGREPPVILLYSLGETKIQSLDELLLERDELLRVLKINFGEARN